MKLRALTIMAISTFFTQSILAEEKIPSQSELWQKIQQQQKQIQSLVDQIKVADEKVEATIDVIEEAEHQAKSGSSTSTYIGGYGEMHYNNLVGDGGASDKNEIDFHRYVLFIGHEFNDGLRFFSELEIEHSIAGDGQVGAIELEQAFIELDISAEHSLRAGIFMLPVGLINETHEPPAFYGVERNNVEKNIVPATWWAGGISMSGELTQGWHYNVAVHEGLKTSAANAYKPRNGRQKTGEAIAKDLAYTGRLKWTGVRGLEVAFTWNHQSDITQSTDATAGSANLYEGHVVYNKGPFSLKTLAARWVLSGSGPKAIGADKQEGWYIEPAYKLNDRIGVFARYSQYDNAAGNARLSEKKQVIVGTNWWLSSDVVVKADYQIQKNANNNDQNGFNLGIGYQF